MFDHVSKIEKTQILSLIEDCYRGKLLSNARQSTAQVIRVKGVSFNYLQFLWQCIGTIKKTHESGNFAGALKLAAELITYLPESMKTEFKSRADQIEVSINLIRTGKLKQISDIPDFFIRGIYKNRLLQTYGMEALKDFINNLTTKLDNIGYMENTKVVAEGSTEVSEESWLKMQEQAQGQEPKKGKRKRGESPAGIVQDAY
jgi:hypothetical protein